MYMCDVADCVFIFLNVELDHITPAHTISAALCYATQLVNILSHILDVNLPKKLCNRYMPFSLKIIFFQKIADVFPVGYASPRAWITRVVFFAVSSVVII